MRYHVFAGGTSNGSVVDGASELGLSFGGEALRAGLYGGLGAEYLGGDEAAYRQLGVTAPVSLRLRWHLGRPFLLEAGASYVTRRAGESDLRLDDGSRRVEEGGHGWRAGLRLGAFDLLPVHAAQSVQWIDYGDASWLSTGLGVYF